MHVEDLSYLRQQINEIDEELVSLFKRRMKIVYRVANYKIKNSMEVLDQSREEQIISKHTNCIEEEDLKAELREFLEDVLSISRRAQQKLIQKSRETIKAADDKTPGSIGYQGVEGSFSHLAALEYFSEVSNLKNFASFREVFEAIINKEIKYGILPIENSSTGGISEVYDLLGEYGCCIIGEKCIKVEHNLLGIKGASIPDIKEVYSHTQGFLQCQKYLDRHKDWRLIPYFNTAKSAEYVSMENDSSKACVASKKAAELYSLDILEENINYSRNNFTRFIVIGRDMIPNKRADKISLALTLPHKSGALSNILKHFSDSDINLLKIESRPTLNKPFEYSFYIDFQGNISDEKIISVLNIIKGECLDYKFLGNYSGEVKCY